MKLKITLLAIFALIYALPVFAQESPDQAGNRGVVVSSTTTPPAGQASAPAAAQTPAQTPDQQPIAQPAAPQALARRANNAEAVLYTLGPDDVIEITVQRHPEFSGIHPINLEGKIQLKLLNDVDVTGLTKSELEQKLSKLISTYVNNPEVSVTILEYRSKVYYVIGEVAAPGRFYMRSETTTVRDAIVSAGLPLFSAAMRKCVVISPAEDGKVTKRKVNVYAILYGGDLRKNLVMRPNDTLYIPSTVMAKAFRVIAPVAAPVGSAAGIDTGLEDLNTRSDGTTRR